MLVVSLCGGGGGRVLKGAVGTWCPLLAGIWCSSWWFLLPHTRDPQGVTFMCLPTRYYILLFLHQPVSPRYIQIHYVVHFTYVRYFFFTLLFILKIVFILLQVCISLTDHWWFYSCGTTSTKTVALLLSPHTGTPLCHILCLHLSLCNLTWPLFLELLLYTIHIKPWYHKQK